MAGSSNPVSQFLPWICCQLLPWSLEICPPSSVAEHMVDYNYMTSQCYSLLYIQKDGVSKSVLQVWRALVNLPFLWHVSDLHSMNSSTMRMCVVCSSTCDLPARLLLLYNLHMTSRQNLSSSSKTTLVWSLRKTTWVRTINCKHNDYSLCEIEWLWP